LVSWLVGWLSRAWMGPPWGAFCQITLTSCYLNVGIACSFYRTIVWTDVNCLDGSVFKNRIRTDLRFSAHPYKKNQSWCTPWLSVKPCDRTFYCVNATADCDRQTDGQTGERRRLYQYAVYSIAVSRVSSITRDGLTKLWLATVCVYSSQWHQS